MARISASPAYITIAATMTRESTSALGTFRFGSSTSSAMSPALSKPMKLQPISATPASRAPTVGAAEPAPSKSTERGCSRKNTSSTVPMTTLPISSAVIETATKILSARGPNRLAVVASPSTTTAIPSSAQLPGESIPTSPATKGAAA